LTSTLVRSLSFKLYLLQMQNKTFPEKLSRNMSQPTDRPVG